MRKVNAGCKTSLQWPELECAGCGNSWTGGKEPTICIACLNPTCCAECHLQLQHQDICTFYQNFTPIYEVYESINGFRALLHRSILAAGTGQKVTYASPRFLSAQKQDSSPHVLERGFRQYGSPVAGTPGIHQTRRGTPGLRAQDLHLHLRKVQGHCTSRVQLHQLTFTELRYLQDAVQGVLVHLLCVHPGRPHT